MKSMIRTFIVLCLCLFTLPLLAQGRATASDPGSQGRTTASAPPSGTATASSTPTSSARESVSYSGDTARPSGSSGTQNSFPSTGSYGGGTYLPSLQGTSFYSYGTYLNMQNFLFNLRMLYGFSTYGYDTARFMRNSEPLLTPRLASLAVRKPLALSTQLLGVVDELSSLLAEAQSGKPIDKKAVEASAEQIRKLAKLIRSDSSLSFIDLRADLDLSKGRDFDQLGLNAIERLREYALDLNNQLKILSEQSETATVSVDYLTRPSFESLSKGIEKLSRIIQNSARRL
jgi:hypothetical protein